MREINFVIDTTTLWYFDMLATEHVILVQPNPPKPACFRLILVEISIIDCRARRRMLNYTIYSLKFKDLIEIKINLMIYLLDSELLPIVFP